MQPPALLFNDSPSTAPPSGSLRRGLWLVVLLFIVTRLLTWAATYYGAFLLFRIEYKLDAPLAVHEHRLRDAITARQGPEFDTAVDLLGDFAPLCRFDGEHYGSIVAHGYRYAPPPPGTRDREQLEQNIAFFPLFPVLAAPFAPLIGTRVAMILVVHACTLAALVLLFLWIRRRIDERVALYTVAVTLCWPAGVYYSYAYAEAVTLLTCVAACWLIDARRWWPAAVVCALATASRPTALPIAAVLLLAWWFNSAVPRGRRFAWLVPLGLIGAAGLTAYATYLTLRFGSPLVYFDNFKAGWVPDRQRADWLSFLTFTPVLEQLKYFRNLLAFAPPVGLLNAANTLMWNMPLNLFILFLSLVGLRHVPRSFRPLLALGPLIFLQAYFASGGAKFGLEPIARYTAAAVPAFVVLAAWMLRRWSCGARIALFVFFVLVQAAWALRFGMQEWSG